MSEKPFTQRWLNNAYQDSLQPTSQWQRASHLLAERLANSVEAEPAFAQSERFKQMTFQLLGEVFVRTYFPHDTIDPGIITPPSIAWEDRRNLEADCKSWLDAKLNSCAETLPSEASQAVSQFKVECGQLVAVGLDKELHRRQVNYMRDPQKATAMWTAQPSARQPPSGSRGGTGVSSGDGDGASTADGSTHAQPRGPHEPYDAQPPVYSSFHSEHCAESLVALLRSNPDRQPDVYGRLHGRRLPQALRKFVWRESLFKAERKRSGQWNVERFFRERFGKAVARGVGELKIKRATQSPINNLLENAVIETYEKTSSTKELSNPLFLTEAVRVLNVLYVYDRSYEPFLILWLVPLQVAFREEASSADLGEQVYELAMLLSLLHQGTYPGWPTVFAIAERSLELVREADPEFHSHLLDIATRNIDASLKDFMVQVIHEEFERAQSLLRTNSESPRQQRMSKNLLVNPAIFLRKWIGEGFVGVLSLQAALFYWDQCYLTDFASATIEDAALAVLFLLRDRFMSATDYPQMKAVFLTGPRSLYTADVVRAWCHLQGRGDPTLVPEMNRTRPAEPPTPVEGSPTPVPATPVQPTPLPGIRVDQVGVRLQLMKDGSRQKLLAGAFTAEHLTVRIDQRYGDVGLNSHLLTQRSPMKPVEDRTEFRSVQLGYSDVCEFPEADVSQYDLESHLGTVPYLLVQLHYEPPDSEPVTLGWGRVIPYERVLDSGQFAQPRRFRVTCPIYPGYLPDDPLNWQPGDIPDYDEDDPEERQLGLEYRDSLINAYIGDFSELSIHGFPINERPSPAPAKLPTPPPPPPPPPPLKTATPPVKQPTPQPEPEEPQVEPEAVRQPKNIPKRHWTIHDPAIEKTYAAATATNQLFDVYIDQVRYMLDGITIVKLTGRFLNTGHDTEIPDILLVPNPKVSPRNLNFFASQRIQVKASNAMQLQKESVLVIRVYTLMKPTLELVVVGTCVLRIFDDQGRTLTGGHQKRLREHTNVVAANAASVSVNLDTLQRSHSLPCVTVLFRIEPASQRAVDPPEYIGGYYRSEECRPTEFELKVFREHDRYETYPETFAPLLNYVQGRDGTKQVASDYNQVMAYVPARMDPATCLPANTAPNAMPAERHFHYRAMSGANVRLERVFGLDAAGGGGGGLLTFALTSALIGTAQMDGVPSKALGIGHDALIVSAPSPGSPVGAPQFDRRAVALCPRSDPANCILVQLFRLSGVAFRGGKFWRGQEELTELAKEHFVAWALCPLLENEFTFNGRHRCPVFQQSALPLTRTRVRTLRLRGLLGAMKTDTAMPNYVATASALMSVVDGHLSYQEAAANAVVHATLYEYLPKTTPADYQTAIDAAGAGGPLARSVIAADETEAGFVQECQTALENLVASVALLRDWRCSFALLVYRVVSNKIMPPFFAFIAECSSKKAVRTAVCVTES